MKTLFRKMKFVENSRWEWSEICEIAWYSTKSAIWTPKVQKCPKLRLFSGGIQERREKNY